MKYHFHCASTSQESPEWYTMLTWQQQTPVLSKPSHDIKAVFTLVCAYSSRQKSSSKPSIWENTFSFSFLLIFKTYLCNVASIQFTLSNGFVPKVNITPLLHQQTTSALWCQQANNVCNNVMQNKMLYVWWYAQWALLIWCLMVYHDFSSSEKRYVPPHMFTKDGVSTWKSCQSISSCVSLSGITTWLRAKDKANESKEIKKSVFMSCNCVSIVTIDDTFKER